MCSGRRCAPALPWGLQAKDYMDRGDLVPDAVILGLVRETLAQPAFANGAILDGVVRTVPQAEGLRAALRSLGHGRKVDAVLALDVPDDEIVRRMASRTVCDSCQTPYTGRAAGERCDECGGTLVRRKDDEPEAVRNRLAVYAAQTLPVFEWYRAADVPVAVVAAPGSVDDVTRRALAALDIG